MPINNMPHLTSQLLVILTGSGISAESGLNTFRGSDGLWENYQAEDLATPEAFASNPELVHRFYNFRRRQLLQPDIKPNPAHIALARLEKEFSGNFTLITQNVDDLHERAGSSNVIHMHGELMKQRCRALSKVHPCESDLTPDTPCPCCNISGNARPHIVWFGEIPLFMDEIYHALSGCDLFVAIGTSGHVYPAAGFVEIALHAGATTLEMNLEDTLQSSHFEHRLQGRAGKLVPEFVDRLLKSL